MSDVGATRKVLYLAEPTFARQEFSRLYLMVHANIQKVPESARGIHWRHTARSVGSLAFHIAENYEGISPKVEIFSTCTPHTAATAQKVAEILNKNLEKEEFYLEFEVNTEDSGLKTGIF